MLQASVSPSAEPFAGSMLDVGVRKHGRQVAQQSFVIVVHALADGQGTQYAMQAQSMSGTHCFCLNLQHMKKSLVVLLLIVLYQVRCRVLHLHPYSKP